jgi:hypothetical protein
MLQNMYFFENSRLTSDIPTNYYQFSDSVILKLRKDMLFPGNLREPYERETYAAMMHPVPGDKFSEMLSWWVFVVHVDRMNDTMVIVEGSTEENEKYVALTMEEWRERYAYNKTSDHHNPTSTANKFSVRFHSNETTSGVLQEMQQELEFLRISPRPKFIDKVTPVPQVTKTRHKKKEDSDGKKELSTSV